MPLSRSPRMDRRRRAIREGLAASSGQSDESRVSPSRTARSGFDLPEISKKDRGVAYSHSVRRTCQHRLVQFIPVRTLSITGAIATSIAVPLILLTLHYLVFVSGTLAWSRHPMSALLNVASPRSLAAWLASHLWLLCLAATVLTFRLRKHKLDDYEGEYRLWFWLVFTCVIGSIDSTTRLTELFGAALDRWSQLHVGWTGGAIVQATLATLIGMLGLRLCSELKTVPASLVLWLVGLVSWAGSAALSQSLLRIDISPPMREWLRASMWLGGLTSIWLSGLVYLRAVFIEAQQRFLTRTALASANMTPWRERLSQAMPKLPRFGRNAEDGRLSEEEPVAAPSRRKKSSPAAAAARADQTASEAEEAASTASGENRPKRRWGIGSLVLGTPAAGSATASSSKESRQRKATSRGDRNDHDDRDREDELASSADSGSNSRDPGDDEIDREYGKRPSWFRRRAKPAAEEADRDTDESAQTADKQSQRSRFASKLFTRKKSAKGRDQEGDENDAQDEPANQKRSMRDRMRLRRTDRTEEGADKPVRQKEKQKAKEKPAPRADDSEDGQSKRSWLRKPSLPKVSLPKPRLPKLKLPSFRLPPPTAAAEADVDNEGDSRRVPSVSSSRPLPSTSAPNSYRPQAQEDDADNTRGMSKSERKRLKRMQRDEDSDRRAA